MSQLTPEQGQEQELNHVLDRSNTQMSKPLKSVNSREGRGKPEELKSIYNSSLTARSDRRAFTHACTLTRSLAGTYSSWTCIRFVDVHGKVPLYKNSCLYPCIHAYAGRA